MQDIAAAGAPYDPARPRWIACHQGERWCGWHRTSNGVEQWRKFLKERQAHEELCNGGLILL